MELTEPNLPSKTSLTSSRIAPAGGARFKSPAHFVADWAEATFNNLPAGVTLNTTVMARNATGESQPSAPPVSIVVPAARVLYCSRAAGVDS